MKVRSGFISNSSSCSFVLDKGDMTKEQIIDFRFVYYKAESSSDDTHIYESARHFHGSVSMHDELIPAFLKKHNLQADMTMWRMV